MNKNSKKISKKGKEVEDRVAVLVEHFDSKLDLVVEGHEMLNLKIENFKQDIDGRLDGIDERLDGINEQLHLIRNELKEKVSRDEFIALEKRVLLMEKKINSKK